MVLFPKRVALFFSAGFMFILTCLAQTSSSDPKSLPSSCDLYFSGDIQLKNVPVARTEAQRRQGLSHIQDPGEGMLFVFETPVMTEFWMQDTHFPLSIGFIAENGTVFAIEHMQADSKQSHKPQQAIKYALELREGRFEQLGLTIGATFLDMKCHSQ